MTNKPQRGRPRLYDEEVVLEAACSLFWSKGFSDTSLDELSAAMGMNRPSIYRAFGDKEEIYRKSMGLFCRHMREAVAGTLMDEADIRKGLTRFYEAALDLYTAGDRQKGCMVMSTATVAAIDHPRIQADLLEVIEEIDRSVTSRLRRAIDEGQIQPIDDVVTRARMIQGVLHTLSVRARAGESKFRLRKLARAQVELLLP